MDLSWGEVAKTESVPENGITVQGSEAWRKWRGKGIGSSDAAVLLGVSPWKNIHQLWEEKLGLWKPEFGFAQQRAMDRGKELEPKIRNWYEQTRNAFFPDGIAERPENPFMRASFDGINKDYLNVEDGSKGRIIEIKAPNKDDHAGARVGVVPEKYMPQVQWLMMVADVQWCDYVSFGSDGTYAVVSVQADKAMQTALYSRAVVFWGLIQAKVAPKNEFPVWRRDISAPIEFVTVTQNDVKPTVSDQELESVVAKAIAAKAALDKAEEEYKSLTEQLKSALGDKQKMEAGEGVFGWIDRKGAIDYAQIPELIGIDLEQFRKKPTRAFYFKRKDDK